MSCESTFVEDPAPAVPLPPVSPAPRLNAAWEPPPAGRVSLCRERIVCAPGTRRPRIDAAPNTLSTFVTMLGGTGMTVDSGGACRYNPCGAMVELVDCRWSHGPSIQRDAGRTSVPKMQCRARPVSIPDRGSCRC